MSQLTRDLANSTAETLKRYCKDSYGKEFDCVTVCNDQMGGASVFVDHKERTLWIAFMDDGTSSVIFDYGKRVQSVGAFDAVKIGYYVSFLISREVDPLVIAERILTEASDVFKALANHD